MKYKFFHHSKPPFRPKGAARSAGDLQHSDFTFRLSMRIRRPVKGKPEVLKFNGPFSGDFLYE